MLSYNDIHDSYHQKILRYLARIVGPDEAEDVSQEVFLKINKSLETLQDENKLTYWIYRVALNAARDHIRTKKSKIPVVSIEDLSGSMNSGYHSRLKELADTRAKTPDEKLIKDEMMQCYIDYVEKTAGKILRDICPR